MTSNFSKSSRNELAPQVSPARYWQRPSCKSCPMRRCWASLIFTISDSKRREPCSKRPMRFAAISLFMRKAEPTKATIRKNPTRHDVAHAPLEPWRIRSPVDQLMYHQTRLAEAAEAIPHFLPQNHANTKMGTEQKDASGILKSVTESSTAITNSVAAISATINAR